MTSEMFAWARYAFSETGDILYKIYGVVRENRKKLLLLWRRPMLCLKVATINITFLDKEMMIIIIWNAKIFSVCNVSIFRQMKVIFLKCIIWLQFDRFLFSSNGNMDNFRKINWQHYNQGEGNINCRRRVAVVSVTSAGLVPIAVIRITSTNNLLMISLTFIFAMYSKYAFRLASSCDHWRSFCSIYNGLRLCDQFANCYGTITYSLQCRDRLVLQHWLDKS